MTDQRKSVRYQTTAKVVIAGNDKADTLLKDISVTGCRVLCPTFLEIELSSRYELKITPEGNADIGAFELTVESKWIRAGSSAFEFGFFILESPKGKHFQRYVDYLSWRYSQGNSMTGEEPSGIPRLG